MRTSTSAPFLRRTFLLLSVSFSTVFGSGIVLAQDDDPDLPVFARSGISKDIYISLRDQYTDLLRGVPYDRLDRRTTAINLLQRQAGLRALSKLNAVAWTSIGPAPLPNGQTTGTSTPVSGRVTCIAIHPSDPNTVYVGTAQGGVYRTLDGGTTWTAIFDNAQSLAIGALALAPSDPTILYVGTGEANGSCDSYAGVGLYRVDNANTSPVLVGPIDPAGSNAVAGTRSFGGRTISKILVHPTDPATVFVATASGIIGVGCDAALGGTIPPLPPRGIYRSTNATAAAGAVAFTKLTVTTAASISPDATGNRSVLDMVFEPGNPNNMICTVLGFNTAGDGGIFRTTNALAATPTFTQTLSLGTASAQQRANLAINKIGSTVTVIAATAEPPSSGCSGSAGVVRVSTDGGATWSAALAGGGGFCGGQCFYDIAVDIDPANSSIIYLGGSANGTCSGVFKKSTNGGTTFLASDPGLHADTHAIDVAPSNASIVYTGNDGGIWKSTDKGTSWTSLNRVGFNATQFQSIAVHPLDQFFTIGGTQDNGTAWQKPNNTWTRADFGDGGFALIDNNAADNTSVTMYHTYFNQTNTLIGFARVTTVDSAADGKWHLFGCGGTSNGINCTDATLFYAPMALGPGNPNTLYFGTDRLYRSVNRGVNMTPVSQTPIVAGVPISAIGIAGANDSIRIVGLSNGKVFATTTGSSTLTDVTGSLPARFVARAVIDPNNANTAYVTLGGFGIASHVWKNTNLSGGGAGWSPASGSGLTAIPDVPVNAFVIDPLNSTNIYAGTDIGVYASTDGGATWNPFGSGLPVVAVFDMAIQNPSRILRIATHGRGMWEATLEGALPIQLASFTGSWAGRNDVVLTWSTISEVNNYGFEVQRATDVRGPYETIQGSFVAGNRTTLAAHQYSFTDHPATPQQWFYRLAQKDLDGAVHYSDAIAVDVSSNTKPSVFSLSQNYPNPFNPSTVIRYALPQSAVVLIELYDALGQRVKVVVDEREDAGVHEATLTTTGLASGMYFYRMRADNFVASKRLVLLK